MLDDPEANSAGRERFSALVDGELDAAPVAAACGLWRESAHARATWHAYHLIGDVMRSDDLASDPAYDLNFLEAFRARLAVEPVVLAPRPLDSTLPAAGASPAARVFGGGRPSGRRWSWMTPTAVAAGFVAVAGVLTLTRGPVSGGGGPSVTTIASTSAASASLVGAGVMPASVAVVANVRPAVEPQSLVATGQLIRDARLDRYLVAHKQFAGSSALGLPSAYLRNATAEVSGR